MDERALKSTANLASYRAWGQLCLKKSGFQACLSYTVLVSGMWSIGGVFARLGAGHDPRRFILLVLAVAGLAFVFTVLPLVFFSIRLVRYQRQHPWTPPNVADPVSGTTRRRLDRAPRALQI